MDFEKLEKIVGALWRWFFDGEVPRYVITTAATIAAVLAVLFLIAKVIKELKPLFYNATERRRVRRRKRFAEHIVREIDRIDNAADWTEHKYSELEAEVEAEGRRRRRFGIGEQSTLRRERSLSRALRSSRERLILLEGEPGAGKSVALRHLASVVAAAAARSRSSRSIVPLYINLKSIDRPATRAVDAELIREHVLKTLNAANVRDVEEFLNDEFARGLEEGTWLFLFDSFDEIPDILSATTADTSIREYAQAIASFLTSMNACRGVVASRYFRGPGSLGWPRFRILALSDEYRRRLIRRADLPFHVERDLIGQLELADPALAVTSRNPMFLGLMCQHMAKGNPFPENTHVVFEDYVDTRLRRDEDKILRRYGVGSVLVRDAAELAAFCMAYHPTLGLSPTRHALARAMTERGYTGDPFVIFDALEFIKLARPEGGLLDATFTFAHRRFQEYFATSVVLDSPDIVTPVRLLTDARWRETTVVLLQTQTGERLANIVQEVERLLERELATIEAALPSPHMWVENGDGVVVDETLSRQVREFPWPPLSLHLLSLLQSGYQGRASAATPRLRELVGRIVFLATATGTLADRKWALEVAGISPPQILTRAIRDAFTGHSRWLSEVAYRQTALLGSVPDDIARAVRLELLQLFSRGSLAREREVTLAHIQRLPHNEQFLRTARLLLTVETIDHILHAFVFATLIGRVESAWLACTIAVALFLSSTAPYITARLWVRSAAATIDISDYSFASAGLRFLLLWVVHGLVPGVGTALLLVVVGSWSVGAIMAAAHGRLTAIAWWPVLGAFPILFIATNIRGWVNVVRRAFWRLCGLLLFYIGLIVVSVNPWDWEVLEPVRIVMLWVLSSVGGVIVALMLWRAAKRRLADYRLWWASVKPLPRFTTASDVIAMLREFQTINWQARFLELVAQKAMLEPTRENEAIIREVAIEFENGTGSMKSFSGSDIGHGRIVDGLNILAEQLRTRRDS